MYSGIMASLDEAWRPGVKKVVLVLADAPPHDPEPVTGYTADDVIARAFAVDPAEVYVVNTGDATYGGSLSRVVEETGGSVVDAYSASRRPRRADRGARHRARQALRLGRRSVRRPQGHRAGARRQRLLRANRCSRAPTSGTSTATRSTTAPPPGRRRATPGRTASTERWPCGSPTRQVCLPSALRTRPRHPTATRCRPPRTSARRTPTRGRMTGTATASAMPVTRPRAGPPRTRKAS